MAQGFGERAIGGFHPGPSGLLEYALPWPASSSTFVTPVRIYRAASSGSSWRARMARPTVRRWTSSRPTAGSRSCSICPASIPRRSRSPVSTTRWSSAGPRARPAAVTARWRSTWPNGSSDGSAAPSRSDVPSTRAAPSPRSSPASCASCCRASTIAAAADPDPHRHVLTAGPIFDADPVHRRHLRKARPRDRPPRHPGARRAATASTSSSPTSRTPPPASASPATSPTRSSATAST